MKHLNEIHRLLQIIFELILYDTITFFKFVLILIMLFLFISASMRVIHNVLLQISDENIQLF